MNLADLLNHCQAQPGAYEDRPFGPDLIVMKVRKKMFALFQDRDPVESISLKCEPEHALALRAQYPAVTGGYHLNKKHWNSVALDDSIPRDEILEMIDDSYNLVRNRLTKKERQGLSER